MKIRPVYFVTGGIFLGALAGWAYWYFIGCHSGSCPITSIWYHSTIYGAVMGGLLGNIIRPKTSEEEKKMEDAQLDEMKNP